MSDVFRSRRQLWLVLLGVAVVLLLLATRIATFYTDVLWFGSIGYADVFWTLLGTRIGLGVATGLTAAALVVGNLLLARRLAPDYRVPSAQEEAVERYRQVLEPYARPLAIGVGAVIGLLSGLSLANEWETFLLWANRVPFGIQDPQFGLDVGFFVFQLPLLELVNSWLFTTLVLVIVLTAVAHYVFGGIRPQSPGQRILPQVNAHMSVLLALLVGVRAWGFVLDRYLLSYSERGTVTGLSYTDVNAQLLAFQLLAIIAAVCVALFLVNLRFRGWLLPAGGVAILVVAAVVLSGIYPAAIQRLQVDPQELAREEPYIERNLEMTRMGFGIELEQVESLEFPANSQLTDEQVASNSTTLESIRLWDPATLQNTYQQLQVFRSYYDFRDVDVDRYEIDDEQQQVMISVRELNERDIPEAARTWQNQRLFYTHGYGVVSSDVSIARDDGQPVFLQSNIPPEGVDALQVDNPRIYFGELPPEYSIVNSSIDEFDFPTEGGGQSLHRYEGEDGVVVGTPLRRLAFALRYAEPNFVLSGLIEPESKILFNRNIRERVERVAPYLKVDHDPYPAVVGDRVKWIVDTYTTTDMLPYSERVELGPLTAADQRVFETGQNAQGELVVQERTVEVSGIAGRANYIRNSVKAVIDAYDGTVELYVIDDDDPIIQAWQGVFPDSFTPVAEAEPELVEHFRYPEDMFRVQSALFQRYHIPEADDFYSGEDNWATPIDAAYAQNQGQTPSEQRQQRQMRPYYLLMRLPGEPEEEFALIQPFTPANRPNLIGWLAGRSDGEFYGQLKSYLMPPDRTVFGPQQVQARIDQDNDVAQQITLWNQSGSRVIYGNLLVIPVEDSLLYVQPLFLRSQQSDIPELAKTVLVFGNQIVMEDTLASGLAGLYGDAAPGVAEIAGLPEDQQPQDAVPDPGGEDGADGAPDPRVQALILGALERYAEGEQALRDGDLAAYAEANRAAQELLTEAQRLTGGEVPDLPDLSEPDEDADDAEPDVEPTPTPPPDDADA
ncbi:UPF0182 family protein [soil metagenome]